MHPSLQERLKVKIKKSLLYLLWLFFCLPLVCFIADRWLYRSFIRRLRLTSALKFAVTTKLVRKPIHKNFPCFSRI